MPATVHYELDQLCPYIREVGIQRYDSWRTRPRRIYDHQFLYCFTGAAHVRIEDRYYRVTEGNVVVIPPDTPHTFWVEPHENGDLYWFHCDFVYFEDREWIYKVYNTHEQYMRLFSGDIPGREHIRPQPVFGDGFTIPEYMAFQNNEDIDFIFRSLYRAYSKHSDDFAIQSKVLFFRLFSVILTQYGYFSEKNDRQAQVADSIKTYIHNNYFRRLSVRQICENTQLNPDYAGKLFKRETGYSLIDYLNKFRIEKAKNLLLDADLSIADIAEMVGFSGESYFYSVMKRVEGRSPQKMRRHLQAILQPAAQEEMPDSMS